MDVRDPDGTLSSARVREMLKDVYDLDIDLAQTFGVSKAELAKTDVDRLLDESSDVANQRRESRRGTAAGLPPQYK